MSPQVGGFSAEIAENRKTYTAEPGRAPQSPTRENGKRSSLGAMAETWTPPTPRAWQWTPPPPIAPAKPATPIRARSTVAGIPLTGTPDTQTEKKVSLLIERVIRPALRQSLGWTRGILAEALRGATKGVDGHQKATLAIRIFEYVRWRMRYVNDPTGRDMFTALPVTWARGIGDCDDFSAIITALFMAAGIKVRLRIIQTPKATGWNHIYPMAELGGKWQAFDATLPAKTRAGTEAASIRRKDFEVTP